MNTPGCGRLFVASLALLSAAAVGCNRDPATHKTPVVGGTGSATVDGKITFGPLSGANVSIFTVTALGANGTQIASAVTGLTGAFNLNIPVRPVGAVRVVVTGGTFTSELDGSTVDLGTCSFSYLLDGLKAGLNEISLTPVSDMVDALTVGQLGGRTIAASHAEAIALLSAFFGFTGNVETVVPTFTAASIGTDGFKYGLVLGALDTLAAKLSPAARCELLDALSKDVSDGLFDGLDHTVPVPLGGGTLPSTSGTSDFLSSLTNYVNTGKALADEGITPTDIAATVGEIKQGVADSPITPPATGISVGSSGAISTAAFDGKQWVFVAARTLGVVAIDVTDPVATNPTINVWSDLYNTTFSHKDIGGVIPLVGADHPQLFVYAYQSKHAALVNAATGVVEFEADLPIVASSPIGFSGGSAYIAGGIPDAGRDGVWLATADGYYFFNRVTLALEKLYPVDYPAMLAENLGGDVGNGLLWCPNYMQTYVGGVQLVDLNADKSYYMDDAAFESAFRSKGLNFPDAGSVDAKFRIGIITNEDTDDVGFVNLAKITRVDATPPDLSTFLPGTDNGAAHLHLAPSSGIELSGSAVDGTTHLVLMMAGYSRDIAVGKLTHPSEVPSGSWQGFSDWRYNSLSSYNYARDPHAVAAVTNITNNKSYGYLLDGGNHRVLQVDLAAFLATPATDSDGHGVSNNLVTDGVIINRDW